MPTACDDTRRLALELVVRRLAQRIIRNHPRAFENLEPELRRAGGEPPISPALEQALQLHIGRPRTSSSLGAPDARAERTQAADPY